MRRSHLLTSATLDLVQRHTGRAFGEFQLDAPGWVEVEYDIKRGERASTDRAPENCDAGEPPQAIIKHVFVSKAPLRLVASDEMTLTLPTGYDITEDLSKSALEHIEYELLEDELEAA
jgi:hypothetical protein